MTNITHQADAGAQPDSPATPTRRRASRPAIQALPPRLITPADLAERNGFKRHNANGKTEWHGPTPGGGAKTRDGFVLKEDGDSFERGGPHYTTAETARMFDIPPEKYAPYVEWRKHNGRGAGRVTNRNQASRTTLRAPRAAPAQAQPAQPAPQFRLAPDWSNADAIHDYHDEGGVLLFQVARRGTGPGKAISQRRPDGRGGYIYSLDNKKGGFETRRVLYQLPQVLAAPKVLVVEGEKAADRVNAALEAAGLASGCVATTNPHGAKQWTGDRGANYSLSLASKDVVVLPDNNQPGEEHAATACPSIACHAAKLQVLRLPNLPACGDVADFLDAGSTIEQVLALAEAAPDWTQLTAQAERLETEADEWPLLSLEDLFKRPDPTWLIDLLLPTGSVVWLTASHASFKSAEALDVAMCIATAKRFHGRDVKQGRVVYVAAEGIAGIRQRARAWLIHHQMPTPGMGQIAFIESAVQVADEAKMGIFIRQMKRCAPDFIVLDTQSRCSVGRDENSTADSTVFWDAIKKLSDETGAVVYVVHHNNKSGTYRGNSNAPASVDVHFSMEREGNRAKLRCLKQKDGDEAKAHIDFTARVVELGTVDEKGRPHTSIILEGATVPTDDFKPSKSPSDQMRVDILNVLREAPDGLRAGEWQKRVEKKLGIKSSRFYDYRDELAPKDSKDGPAWNDCGIYRIRSQSTPITPIRSESERSERVRYSDHSDDSLESERSEYFNPPEQSEYLEQVRSYNSCPQAFGLESGGKMTSDAELPFENFVPKVPLRRVRSKKESPADSEAYSYLPPRGVL